MCAYKLTENKIDKNYRLTIRRENYENNYTFRTKKAAFQWLLGVGVDRTEAGKICKLGK